MEKTEERISEHEGRIRENNESGQRKNRMQKNKQTFKDLWEDNKRSNIHVIGVA